jgi:hypothetical protein
MERLQQLVNTSQHKTKTKLWSDFKAQLSISTKLHKQLHESILRKFEKFYHVLVVTQPLVLILLPATKLYNGS